jgi:hypothetical protein
MNSIKSAGNYVSNKVQGGAHTASKKTNKEYVFPFFLMPLPPP